MYAGHYAKFLFGAKWIMDFRDPPIKRGFFSIIWNIIVKKTLIKKLKDVDNCVTVTDGLSDEISRYNPNVETITINNGYEPIKYETNNISNEYSEKLTLCFTGGTLYERQLLAVKELVRCISCIIQNGSIDKSKLVIIYAGNDYEMFERAFIDFGIVDIIVNKGYCDRKGIINIQNESDIFLDLGWNTKKYQGHVSGKFYEGIRAQKYILSLIAAEIPNSEMYMYNVKYNYGFCYETCRGEEHFNDMCDWIVKLYHQKMETKRVLFSNNPKLEEAFDYQNLTKKLLKKIEKLKDD